MVYGSIAFIFPNMKDELTGKDFEDFVESVDKVESATKLDFFTEFDTVEAFDESEEGNFIFWFGGE